MYRLFVADDKLMDKFNSYLIQDILAGTADTQIIDLEALQLNHDTFQVVICDSFYSHDSDISYHFSDLLCLDNPDNNNFNEIMFGNFEVILLKGGCSVRRFGDVINHYNGENTPPPQKNSPLDHFFLAYGSVVTSISEIHRSYSEAYKTLKRRFFCCENRHILGFDDLVFYADNDVILNQEMLADYADIIFNAICSFRREKTAAILLELQNRLTTACDSIEDVRLFLTDLYLLIKERTNHLYGGSKVNFPGNADIIREIQHKQYLYEIIGMFTMQFESIISVIGVSSSDTVVDEVLDYMEHHYMENIKLEGIAPLFGYNSSYLGKLFSRKVGENFNLHLDRIRIEHAKDILRREDMKVYEIAENIGYNNVDYFHIKFKRFVGTTPAEYRKNYGETTA